MSLYPVDVTDIAPVDNQLMYFVKWWENNDPNAYIYAFHAAMELLEWIQTNTVDDDMAEKIAKFIDFVELRP